MKTFVKSIFILMVVFLVPSMGFGQISGGSASSNSVKIISISPDTAKPLYVGEIVEIEVEVEYAISNSPASITLNIQKGEMGGNMLDVVIASKAEVITEKKGTVEIKQSIVVPDTSSISIFTPLLSQGGTSTTVADMRFYQVLKKDAE